MNVGEKIGIAAGVVIIATGAVGLYKYVKSKTSPTAVAAQPATLQGSTAPQALAGLPVPSWPKNYSLLPVDFAGPVLPSAATPRTGNTAAAYISPSLNFPVSGEGGTTLADPVLVS